MNRDVVGLPLGGIVGCVKSIEHHIKDVTPNQYKRLGAVYDQLLAIQQEVAGIPPERDRLGLYHTHEPLVDITSDRLQVELHRVAMGEEWGPTQEALVVFPQPHLKALLKYVERLEHKLASPKSEG